MTITRIFFLEALKKLCLRKFNFRLEKCSVIKFQLLLYSPSWCCRVRVLILSINMQSSWFLQLNEKLFSWCSFNFTIWEMIPIIFKVWRLIVWFKIVRQRFLLDFELSVTPLREPKTVVTQVKGSFQLFYSRRTIHS